MSVLYAIPNYVMFENYFVNIHIHRVYEYFRIVMYRRCLPWQSKY